MSTESEASYLRSSISAFMAGAVAAGVSLSTISIMRENINAFAAGVKTVTTYREAKSSDKTRRRRKYQAFKAFAGRALRKAMQMSIVGEFTEAYRLKENL